MKSIKNLLLFIAVFIINFNIFSYEKYIDFDLIKNASAPRFVNDGILFTTKLNEGEKIFLRSNIDNWQKNYYFLKNFYGIYYSFVPLNNNINTVLYKININGFWEIDPNNLNYIEDDIGNKISITNIPVEARYYKEMPEIEKNNEKIKRVYFQYYNPDAKEVNFICSVDNWCQNSYQMEMDAYGNWALTKNFAKGIYYYYFFVDGRKIIDFDNKNRIFDKIKGQLSYFIVD